MKPVSEVCDLRARDGRHAHGKVMVFVVIVGALLAVVLNLGFGNRPLAWPEVALLLGLVVAAHGADTIKAIAKIRWERAA